VDHARQVAELLDVSVDLSDANVVLVDNVDSAPVVVGTLRIESRLSPSDPTGALLLRESDELLDYLQCGIVLPDSSVQAQVAFACAQVLGDCEKQLGNARLQSMLQLACVPRQRQ
jgi:hypothetical protein